MTVANPNETIEPTSTYEALKDTTRYLGTIWTRDRVIEFFTTMEPHRILNTALGEFVEPPASNLELILATTVGHYGSTFRDSHVGVITMLATLQDEVTNGGVFVGNPAQPQPQQ